MKWRLVLFFTGAVLLGGLYLTAITRLPAEDKMHNPYGRAINTLVVRQRHSTDAVTAVNFDYRGFDTLGEEYILFISVMGTLVLLRETAEKKRPEEPDAQHAPRKIRSSDAVRIGTLALVGPTVVFGIYVITHGQLTPGGGFQGGVIVATVPFLVYLSNDFKTFKRIAAHPLVEIAEACGAAAFGAIGVIAFFYSKPYLTNVLPLGKKGSILSGGTIPLISLATGLEVGAGLVLLMYAFLQETLSGGKKET